MDIAFDLLRGLNIDFNLNLSGVAKAHIKKTYITLASMMFLSSAAFYLYATVAMVRLLQPVAFLAAIVSILWFTFTTPTPQNYKLRQQLLFTFAVSKGLIIAPFLEYIGMRNPSLIFTALSSTMLIFAFFTISALKAPSNYFQTAAVLSSITGVMFWIQILNMFVYSNKLQVIELYMGVGVFSLYCLYDTQQMVNRANNGVKDELGDAMRLYVDFFELFVRILVILNRNKEEKRNKRNRR